jgi:hypothetical protein
MSVLPKDPYSCGITYCGCICVSHLILLPVHGMLMEDVEHFCILYVVDVMAVTGLFLTLQDQMEQCRATALEYSSVPSRG